MPNNPCITIVPRVSTLSIVLGLALFCTIQALGQESEQTYSWNEAAEIEMSQNAANVMPCNVLHYTETSGFNHNTRVKSLAMFEELGAENNFTVTNDVTGEQFNSLASLQAYDIVVFSNTSGNQILDSQQRANFEAYINAGGSYLGIHAATDTYRHSTANGGSTGSWDFYAEMVGASVQTGPNHVSGTPVYTMGLIGSHPTTTNIPDPWTKSEEYYYWENGYFGPNNTPVLEVEETVGPNGQVNSYDAARPTTWVRELSGGGRMFYTALGHSGNNFDNDQEFRNLIRDGLKWATGKEVTVDPEAPQDPYLGIPQTIPGLIELEWFDTGGQNISYSDDGQSQGSNFRNSENVDVVDKVGASNQLAIGYTNSGEWMEYTVDIAAGTYDIELLYGTGATDGGRVDLSVDGVEIAVFNDLPSTGNTNTFLPVTIPSIEIAETSSAILRVTLAQTNNLDVDAINFIAVAVGCAEDLNGDGIINIADLLSLISDLGLNCNGCPSDLDGNDMVNIADLLIMVGILSTSCD